MTQAVTVLSSCVLLPLILHVHAGAPLHPEAVSSSSLLRRELQHSQPTSGGNATKTDPSRYWAPRTVIGGDEGPCRAGTCASGMVLRPPGMSPTLCKFTGHCSSEECCLGTCSSFICPNFSVISDTMPRACNDHTCTSGECCTGICNPEALPSQFAIAIPADSRPEKCASHPCLDEECFYGTCGGITCPAGSVKKNHEPAKCESYPCKAEECCVHQCTSDLCTQNGIDNKLIRDWENDAFWNASLNCSGFPCSAQDCCQGTCDSFECGWKHPVIPQDERPSQCKGYNCVHEECCESECTLRLCQHHSAQLKAGKDENSACTFSPCDPHECCAANCTSDMCLSEFGLQDRSPFPDECATYNCTISECCVSFCNDAVCDATRGFSLRASNELPNPCAEPACATSECCNENVVTENTATD